MGASEQWMCCLPETAVPQEAGCRQKTALKALGPSHDLLPSAYLCMRTHIGMVPQGLAVQESIPGSNQ